MVNTFSDRFKVVIYSCKKMGELKYILLSWIAKQYSKVFYRPCNRPTISHSVFISISTPCKSMKVGLWFQGTLIPFTPVQKSIEIKNRNT